MSKPADLKDIVKFFKNSGDAFERALTLAQITSIKRAEIAAKGYAQKNFLGRNNRRLSGALINAITAQFTMRSGGGVPDASLGTVGIPYGAVHEFGTEGLPGGVITPKSARKLWIPSRVNAGRMTPREFINLMKAQPERYFITDKGAFRSDGTDVYTPMFYRVDQVRIKARPYIRPGISDGYEKFHEDFEKFYKQEIDKL